MALLKSDSFVQRSRLMVAASAAESAAASWLIEISINGAAVPQSGQNLYAESSGKIKEHFAHDVVYKVINVNSAKSNALQKKSPYTRN